MRRWRSPVLLLVAGTGAVLLLVVPLAAGSQDAHRSSTTPGASSPHSPEATHSAMAGPGLSRLVLACRASTTLPYSGVQQVRVVTATGERTSTVDVAHEPGSGVRLSLPAGESGGGGMLVDQLAAPSLLPVVDEATLARIASRYAVRGPVPGPPIAGRDTDLLELVRTYGASTGSVAARFWLDRQTSLPLQREVVDAAGHVQQASTYISISYRPPSATPRVTEVVGNATDLGQGVTAAELDGLRRDGWLAPGQVADGFDLVDARLHGTPAVSQSGPQRTGPVVLQLGYTDGISLVSVFEQRGRLDASSLTGWSKQRRGGGEVYVDDGTPRRMVWSGRGSVYTVVSDDPTVADAVLAAWPAPVSHVGVGTRLRHGAERLASWINPFG